MCKTGENEHKSEIKGAASQWYLILSIMVVTTTILATMLMMSSMMEMVSSRNQDIVLKFGDNSLRIEHDKQDPGGDNKDRVQR